MMRLSDLARPGDHLGQLVPQQMVFGLQEARIPFRLLFPGSWCMQTKHHSLCRRREGGSQAT